MAFLQRFVSGSRNCVKLHFRHRFNCQHIVNHGKNEMFKYKSPGLLSSFSNDHRMINTKAKYSPNSRERLRKKRPVSLAVQMQLDSKKLELNEIEEPNENFVKLEKYFLDSQMDIDHVEEHESDIYKNLLSSQTGQNTAEKVYEVYSGPDPDEPISDVACCGCGALLHCQDMGLPGFLPARKYKALTEVELKKTPCQRCYLMQHHNIALNVAVKPEEYNDIIQNVKQIKALIVVVVDVMDMKNSLYPNLKDLIGIKRPVFIVGNKIDLMPKDGPGYLERIRDELLQTCVTSGLTESKFVKHVSLISAKTGFGVEDLVTRLMKDWARKGQVYIVGSTNVGKSTLFNILLNSDYCRAPARDFIHRATTCIWPGTTLNLLRFPIVDPAPWRLKIRAERLLRQKTEEQTEMEMRREKLKSTGKLKFASLMGHVGTSFESKDSIRISEDYNNVANAMYTFESRTGTKKKKVPTEDVVPEVLYNEKIHKGSRWCYDSPGVVNSAQIINRLRQDELAVLLSSEIHVPRTFVLKPGQVLFVSGLGRLDYLSGPASIYFTIVTCANIPGYVKNYDEADDFYRKHIGTKYLGLPLGDSERLDKLPALIGSEMSLTGMGWRHSAGDVLLSSLGWCAVAAGDGHEIKLRAFTPGGAGCSLRQPSLLPYAVNLKGKRKRKSREFKVRQMKI